MLTSDLDFQFPNDLIALTPSRPTRVAFANAQKQSDPQEITLLQLLEQFASGDLLVVNESKVIPARVFSASEVEVLFLQAVDPLTWLVLFPARDLKIGEQLAMPAGLTLTLLQKGLPQTVQISKPIDAEYFAKYGEVALPPYIQEARGERHNRGEDRDWYQSTWARDPGSVAAPTASLHFQAEHLQILRARGVQIAPVTLHVGAGTFLPVRASQLSEHQMHEELARVPASTWNDVVATQARGGRVWALGTTVTRTLESRALGLLTEQADGSFAGATQLLIYPPYKFQVVDALLTNFHQPKSTLFALVAAFAGLEYSKKVYEWAMARRFHLFSYGDLSAWTRN